MRIDGACSQGRRLAGAALLVSAGTIVPFLIWGERVEAATRTFLAQSGHRPLLAACVLCGLLAVDVIAPIPSSLVGTACGLLLGFAPGLLVGFVGLTLACAGGYALGWYCRVPAARMLGDNDLRLLERLHARWGFWVLAAMRPVPVLAEVSVLFAGLARMPVRSIVPVLLLSNLGIAAAYAAIGAWAAQTGAFLPAILGAILLPSCGMLAIRRSQTV